MGTPSNFNGFRVLAALLHGTLVVGVSQTLRCWTQGVTIFGRAAIMLGIGPHSNLYEGLPKSTVVDGSMCQLANCHVSMAFFQVICWCYAVCLLRAVVPQLIEAVHTKVIRKGWNERVFGPLNKILQSLGLDHADSPYRMTTSLTWVLILHLIHVFLLLT